MVSTTLSQPDWGPTTLISTNVADQLRELKTRPGKNINVGASGTLVGFLLKEGLLDELLLIVHPIVVGAGRHLFEQGEEPVPLELLETTTFSTGVAANRYTPATT